MSHTESAYLLYDAGCGPCTRFMKLVKLLDVRKKLVPVSLHDSLSSDLVQGVMSRDQMFRSFHLVQVERGSEKHVYSAGDGVIHLVGYFPLGKTVMAILERTVAFRKLVNWGYLQATRIRKTSCATANRRATAIAFRESPAASFEVVSPTSKVL